MKFTCSLESLIKQLTICESIISAKGNISILSNILIEAKNSKIKITACDTTINFFGEIGADIESEGSITVYSSKLYSLAKKMPSDEIIIETDSSNNFIIQPKGKKNIIYKLKGIDSDKFPETISAENQEYFPIKKNILLDMINKTKFAVSQNESRRFVSGILFEIKNNILKMVSTDGKRLSKIEKEIENKSNLDISIIVPPKILLEISKLCNDNGEAFLSITKDNIFIKIDNFLFISNLLEANFPPYEQVIPKNQTGTITLEKKSFKESIERISLMGDKETHKIILLLTENEMKIYSESLSLGSGEETISVDYIGEETKMAINFIYLIDVLSVLSNENIIIDFKNSQSTITVREKDNNDYIYIMMPMSL